MGGEEGVCARGGGHLIGREVCARGGAEREVCVQGGAPCREGGVCARGGTL